MTKYYIVKELGISKKKWDNMSEVEMSQIVYTENI